MKQISIQISPRYPNDSVSLTLVNDTSHLYGGYVMQINVLNQPLSCTAVIGHEPEMISRLQIPTNLSKLGIRPDLFPIRIQVWVQDEMDHHILSASADIQLMEDQPEILFSVMKPDPDVLSLQEVVNQQNPAAGITTPAIRAN